MKEWIKSNRIVLIIAGVLGGILLSTITITLQNEDVSQSQDENFKVYLENTDTRLNQIISSSNLVINNPKNKDLITDEFNKIEENFIRLDQNLLLCNKNISKCNYSDIFIEMSSKTKSIYSMNQENIELSKEDIKSLQQRVNTFKEFRDLIIDSENNISTSITPSSFTDLIIEFQEKSRK